MNASIVVMCDATVGCDRRRLEDKKIKASDLHLSTLTKIQYRNIEI